MFSVKLLCLEVFTTISNMAIKLWLSAYNLGLQNSRTRMIRMWIKPNQTKPLTLSGMFLGLVFWNLSGDKKFLFIIRKLGSSGTSTWLIVFSSIGEKWGVQGFPNWVKCCFPVQALAASGEHIFFVQEKPFFTLGCFVVFTVFLIQLILQEVWELPKQSLLCRICSSAATVRSWKLIHAELNHWIFWDSHRAYQETNTNPEM